MAAAPKSAVSASKPQALTLEALSQSEILKIIVTALTETIAGYTRTPVSPGIPALQAKSEKSDIAVGGLIRFESEAFSIELFLGFSSALFSMLYENMFQMAPDEISSENHDLAGEVLNIAFGAMDPKFRAQGYRLVSSLPVIYSGVSLVEVLAKMDAQAIVIPYTASGKKFVVNVYSAGSLKVHWKYPGVKQ